MLLGHGVRRWGQLMVQKALVGHNGGRRREEVGAGAAEDEVAALEGATSGVSD